MSKLQMLFILSGVTTAPAPPAKQRAPLAGIMATVDRNLPVILLDHQPVDHGELLQNGVDLQLSGHTHRGQFFPNNLITRRIFAVDWGYLRYKSLQVVVSAGYGTWGPPIRIGGNRSYRHRFHWITPLSRQGLSCNDKKRLRSAAKLKYNKWPALGNRRNGIIL